MISKHIVLSMIVIGCLVQFITCPTPVDNINNPSSNGASKPSSSKPSLSKPSSSKPSSSKPSSSKPSSSNPSSSKPSSSKPSSSKPSSSNPSSSKPSSSKPSSGGAQGNPPQGAKKSGARPASKTGVQPRGLQEPNGSPENNGQVKDPKTSAKKPTGSKKPKASNNQNINSIPENEELEEAKPTGRFRRVFKMFNGLRRKICPIRLFGKVMKKTREFGTNMFGTVMNTMKSKSTDDNDAVDFSQNNA